MDPISLIYENMTASAERVMLRSKHTGEYFKRIEGGHLSWTEFPQQAITFSEEDIGQVIKNLGINPNDIEVVPQEQAVLA